MNIQRQNNPELDNLLVILSEHPDEKDNLLPRIMNFFPWGDHPAFYIETINDPGKRVLIRDQSLELLIEEKQLFDLNLLLNNTSIENFTEKGVFLFTFFTEDINYSYDDLGKMLDDLAIPLKERIDALENLSDQEIKPEALLKTKINIFLQYFFKELNFTGNIQDPYFIDNYLIHKVLATKTGGAIILCVLASAIAHRAGINLPVVITAGHFLLRPEIDKEIPYIDPFLNGRIISEYEHMANVAQKGYDPSIALLHIYSPLTLLLNLARNIMQAVQATGNKELLVKVKAFHEILKQQIHKEER